jgi:type 1 glutamine amidotransferase
MIHTRNQRNSRAIVTACFALALSFAYCDTKAEEPATSAASAKRTRIVLIGHAPDHPFGSHMYLHECGMLAKCLNQTPGVDAVVSDRWPNDPKVLENVRAIVCYTSPGGNLLLSGRHAKAAEALFQSGVGYTAIHWGTGAEGTDIGERYLQILGGWFSTKIGCGLDVSPSRVRQLDPTHPICRGWKDFDLREEWYLRTRLHPDAKPLFAVTVKGHDQVIAWTFERPNSRSGRSFGTTLGHFHDNFCEATFRRVLVNGILWTAHLEVPEAGAPVDVTAKDLELGPPPKQTKR